MRSAMVFVVSSCATTLSFVDMQRLLRWVTLLVVGSSLAGAMPSFSHFNTVHIYPAPLSFRRWRAFAPDPGQDDSGALVNVV